MRQSSNQQNIPKVSIMRAADMNLAVVPRTKWDPNADPSPQPRRTIQNVLFMNTHSDPCHDTDHCLTTVKKLRLHNVTVNHLPDLRYNFLIGADGEVYEGLGWNRPPSLPGNIHMLNENSLLIGVIGLYTGFDLPEKYAEASAKLIWTGVSEQMIARNFSFKNIMNKAYNIQYRLDTVDL